MLRRKYISEWQIGYIHEIWGFRKCRHGEMGLSQVEQDFSSFFAKFLPLYYLMAFFIMERAENTAELWKIIKNVKKLAKNEEKPGPEINEWVVH